MKYCCSCMHYSVCKYAAKWWSDCPDHIERSELIWHGRWLELLGNWKNAEGIRIRKYECSRCHEIVQDNPYRYCPHCGAKMDGD